MARKKLRMGLPKKKFLEPHVLEGVAMGVGLTGIYAFLSLAVPLALPRLVPVIALYASGVALAFSWWLAKYGRKTGERWALLSSIVLLIVVGGKPLAAYMKLTSFYQGLLDELLFITASLTLHQVAKNERIPPQVRFQMDRFGGLAFMSAFLILIPIPLVVALALIVLTASLMKGYTLLMAIARASR